MISLAKSRSLNYYFDRVLFTKAFPLLSVLLAAYHSSEVKPKVNHKFFHGRVITTDRTVLSTLLLAACFLAGAFAGNRFAGSQMVCDNYELQEYLTSFTVLLETGELSAASFQATLFSYCKYPALLFLLGFVSFGAFCIPVVLFYQGFSVSFAVSAFIYAAGEHSVALAVLLFGLRWLLVLPCCFFLASYSMQSSSQIFQQGKKQGSIPYAYPILRFVFCLLLMMIGTFVEYIFLPKWICMIL